MIVIVVYLCTVLLLNIKIDGLHSFSIFKTASSYIGGGIPSKVYSASVGNNALLKAQSAPRSDVNKPDRFIHPQVLKMFRRAQFLIRNGDNAVAKKLLQRCLELSPFDSHSWLALARLEAKIGNIENARKIFSQSNDKCPRNLHLLHAWGHLEQKHGNIDVARDCWSRALELDPLNAYVCHALSNLEKRLRNFDRAREVLTNVVNRRPTAALCVSLAELERALGRPEEARGVLLSGIENCQTEKSTLLLSLAWLEEDAFDKPDEAAAMIDEALHLDSKNIRVYIAKASILLRQQKVSEARAVLQACAGLKSDDGQHYTMWSTLELEDGNPSEARTILQEGARLYPGDQFLLQRWGTLESRLGNIEKARELFAKSVLIQPHAPTFVAWAILEEGEGIKALNKSSSWSGPNMMKVVPNSDRAVANSIADEISELESQSHEYSSHPDLHAIPTMAYGKEHSNSSQQASVASYAAAKFKEARNLFSIGMEVDPYHGPLYHAFGNSELRKWNISGAREIFQLGIRNNCSDVTALYHALGLLEIKDGHRSLAGDIFRKGIELGLKGNREVDPGVGFLLHSLGMLELDNRNLLEAKTVFATGISLFPNHSQMLLGQALVSMKLGEHQQARLFFRQSVDADAIHLHAWQSWAIAEKQFGNIELARILFRQGLKHGPMHGALWQGYAVMEMQQGNSEIARSLFAQAVRRAPSHAQSYQAWACLEVRLGNLEQAKALAWEGVRRAPSHAALWTVAGLVEERLGNTAKAREVLKMGLDLFPSHGALYKVLGELEMKHGAVALARELFSRGLDEDPYYAPVYHAAALLEAKTGNLEKLSELHKKAKAYFSSSMKKMLSAKGGKHALNDVDSIPIVDITLDDERNSREKENIDIIKRIQILEQTAQDSLRNGKDFIQDINVEEQQYGIDSESFMINLGHQ